MLARLSAGRGPSAPAASRSRQHGGPGRLPRALPAGPGFPADGLISAAPDRSRRAQSGARSTRRAGAPSAPDRVSGRAVGGLGGGGGERQPRLCLPVCSHPQGSSRSFCIPVPLALMGDPASLEYTWRRGLRGASFFLQNGHQGKSETKTQGFGYRQSGAHRSTGPGTLLAGGMLATPRPGEGHRVRTTGPSDPL